MNKCVYVLHWVGVFLLNMLCYLSWLYGAAAAAAVDAAVTAAIAAAAERWEENFVHARRAYTLAFTSHTFAHTYRQRGEPRMKDTEIK